MKRIPQHSIFAALVCLAAAARLLGQAPTATLSGIITDPSGGVVPGMTVTAVNPATAQRAVVTINDQGFYVLTQLPIGEYTVEAERAGPCRWA